MLVRSDPPEAVIYVDGKRVGETGPEEPLIVGFEHYGTRSLEARRQGFVPRRLKVSLEPPWYQHFPIGFFAEVLWPGVIRDDHEVGTLHLEPRSSAEDPQRVEERALKAAAQSGPGADAR